MIKAPFRLKIVRECRGIILKKDTWEIVCHPFHKFGNYGESYVPKDFDWNDCYVSEKIDGSLIKIWYHNKTWHISTNGNIDANDANTITDRTFYDLVMRTLTQDKYELILDDIRYGTDKHLEFGYTHLFELCTFDNIVVINYGEDKLFYLGSIENNTYETVEFPLGDVPVPSVYNISSLKGCLSAVEDFDKDQEGLVVTDINNERLKIKSLLYITLHHQVSNCNSPKNILGIVKRGETEEFLTYFPHSTDELGKYVAMWKEVLDVIKSGMTAFDNTMWLDKLDRKSVAVWIMGKYGSISSILFSYYDKKILTVEDWEATVTPEQVIKSKIWSMISKKYE
jgi:hypothetical protein